MASLAEDMPPLRSTHNLSRLVVNLKAIGERRKLERLQKQVQNLKINGEFTSGDSPHHHYHDDDDDQQQQHLHDDMDKDPSDTDQSLDDPASSGDETNTASSGDDSHRFHSDLGQSDPSGQQSEDDANQAHLPRFKGKLPSEVTLAELTEEFKRASGAYRSFSSLRYQAPRFHRRF